MSTELIATGMLSSLIICILLGYPIALTMAGIATIFGLIFVGPNIVNILVLRVFETYTNYTLIAVPLFIFMGIVVQKSGLAGKLFDSMYVIMGRLKGGLALAAMVTATLFAAATGVVGAAVVTMGIFALPAMLNHKYNKSLATGVICAGGTLGILIPPSVMIILWGPMASLSVGRLLMGAFVPGLMLSVLYLIYIYVLCRIKPEWGPSIDESRLNVPLRKKIIMFVTSVLPVASLILGVLGLIFFGVAAPTEAAGIGAFLSLILALCYRALNYKNIKEIIYETVKVTSMIFFVAVGATLFTGVFLRLDGGDVVSSAVLGISMKPWVVVSFMFLMIFILGIFIDWIGIVMICVPLFTPIAHQVGVDAYWFAMTCMIVMQTSFLTPPFAYSIFYLKSVSPPEVQTVDIYRGVWPFIVIQIIGVTLCAIFPQIITWLPSISFGG